MTDVNKMKCRDCGIEMNHHADKVDYSVNPGSAGVEFGGVLQEVHCCPGCGKTEMRIGISALLPGIAGTPLQTRRIQQ